MQELDFAARMAGIAASAYAETLSLLKKLISYFESKGGDTSPARKLLKHAEKTNRNPEEITISKEAAEFYKARMKMLGIDAYLMLDAKDAKTNEDVVHLLYRLDDHDKFVSITNAYIQQATQVYEVSPEIIGLMRDDGKAVEVVADLTPAELLLLEERLRENEIYYAIDYDVKNNGKVKVIAAVEREEEFKALCRDLSLVRVSPYRDQMMEAAQARLEGRELLEKAAKGEEEIVLVDPENRDHYITIDKAGLREMENGKVKNERRRQIRRENGEEKPMTVEFLDVISLSPTFYIATKQQMHYLIDDKKPIPAAQPVWKAPEFPVIDMDMQKALYEMAKSYQLSADHDVSRNFNFRQTNASEISSLEARIKAAEKAVKAGEKLKEETERPRGKGRRSKKERED